MEKNRQKRFLVSLLIFILLLANYAYFLPRWADWGQNARLDLAFAVVDQGTLCIDDYYQNTGDYALFEGHHYMDKAPGPSFLAIPVYAAVKPILHLPFVEKILDKMANSSAFEGTLNEEGSGLLRDKIYFAVVQYILTLIVIAVPSALLGVLLFWFLQDLGAKPAWSLFTVLTYGLASNAFTYAGSFNSHQLTAFLLFSGFYIGYRIRKKKMKPGWSLLAGFLLGYTVICEYPAALIAGGIFVYVLFALPNWRWRLGFTACGVPPAIMLMVYDWLVFRTPWPVGYQYSELYTDLHSSGFVSITYPHWDALWGITFGSYRGLFFLAPILLAGIIGLVAWGLARRDIPEWLVCAWAVLSFILFNGSSVMWQGGYGVGPRYLVPMLPFLALGFFGFPGKWQEKLWVKLILGTASAWSIFAIWVETIGGQSYPDWTYHPLFNYSFPHILSGNIARNLGMLLGLRGLPGVFPLWLFDILVIIFLFWVISKKQELINEKND